jgi:Ca2+-binding EF-hand superfamily protein
MWKPPVQTDPMGRPDPLEWRIKVLFESLDVANKGYLDLKNLRDGLKRIDHRTNTS